MLFMRAAKDGIANVPDAPPTLRALFEDIERTPAWVDPELVDRGARVFRRFGADEWDALRRGFAQ